MITNKKIPIISAIFLVLCLALSGLIVYAANFEREAAKPEYQSRLFGDEVISLDIQTSAENWQTLLDNAQSKEWISADVNINSEQFSNVGIRTKGNSTLLRSDTDRYSLQIKFNKYERGQTYYGLDAFCVNNMSGDSTYMKDYLAYDLMGYIGVNAPLTNYADVSVNGQHYSFGVALERYDRAYLGRAFNTSGGQLYSAKIEMGMRGNFEGWNSAGANAMPSGQGDQGGMQDGQGERQGGMQGGMPNFEDMQSMFGGEIPKGLPNMGSGMPEGFPDMNGRGMQGGFPNMEGGEMSDMSQFRGGGMFGGNGGGSLVYSGDDFSNYSVVFNNNVFSSNSDKDKQRVVTAIKNLNQGTDLEKYIDVDATLRYFAAHNVLVNMDSYTSNMAQNYYIYEHDGRLTILPWDYGLAFGSFMSGSSTDVVNFPIDTPVSGVNMEDRPLLNKLLEVDEYKERYHVYLREIVEGYFESGRYEETINSVDEKINAYFKSDTTALSTYEQYQNALPELIEFGELRAESIKGQLDGTIPSTTDGQKENNSSLVDGSSLSLSALGTMGAGGGGDGPEGQGRQFGGRGDMGGMMRGGEVPAGGGMPGMNNVPAMNSLVNAIIFIGLLLLLGGAIFFVGRRARAR